MHIYVYIFIYIYTLSLCVAPSLNHVWFSLPLTCLLTHSFRSATVDTSRRDHVMTRSRITPVYIYLFAQEYNCYIFTQEYDYIYICSHRSTTVIYIYICTQEYHYIYIFFFNLYRVQLLYICTGLPLYIYIFTQEYHCYIYIYTGVPLYIYGVWSGFGKYDRLNYRSLLQKKPIKETIFCKRDL